MELSAVRMYGKVLWQDPERMSGAICFYGTRVRLEDFYAWIETGGTVSEFLQSFPSVSEEMIREVLRLNQADLTQYLEAA